MNRIARMISALGMVCPLLIATLPAATLTYVGATGGSWHDPANWATNGLPVGREPDGADVILLQSRTVRVTATARMREFGSGSGGTVEIDGGGTLAGTGSYTVRHVATLNVNSNGTLTMGADWLVRTTVNVKTGGLATGSRGIPQAEGRTITVDGTWSPRGTSVAQGTTITVGAGANVNYWGKVRLRTTGTIILDLFANGSSETFYVSGETSSTELTLNAGAIQLRPQGSYVPKPGDSFTLWTKAPASVAVLNLGDGSNISIVGSPYLLDTSRWVAEGVVTVVKPKSPGTVLFVY